MLKYYTLFVDTDKNELTWCDNYTTTLKPMYSELGDIPQERNPWVPPERKFTIDEMIRKLEDIGRNADLIANLCITHSNDLRFKNHFLGNRWLWVASLNHEDSVDKLINYLHKLKTYHCNKVHIADNYNKRLAGRPVIYTSLFKETRAILSGERKLFANTRAWLLGRGTLFADTIATLKGKRPLFANTRAAFGFLNLKNENDSTCNDQTHIKRSMKKN